MQVAEEILSREGLSVTVASISDAFKLDFARRNGLDGRRLIEDRKYKEQHRGAMAADYQRQRLANPNIDANNFLKLLGSCASDVMIVTGMREKGAAEEYRWVVRRPITSVLVEAGNAARSRRGWKQDSIDSDPSESDLDSVPGGRWDLRLSNDAEGPEKVQHWVMQQLLPTLTRHGCGGGGSDGQLQELGRLVQSRPDFPQPGMTFRDIVGLVEQPRGLQLCTLLLQEAVEAELVALGEAPEGLGDGGWRGVDALVGVQSGGYMFAAPLAFKMEKRVVRVMKSGAEGVGRPGPVASSSYRGSHINTAQDRDTHMTEQGTGLIQDTCVSEQGTALKQDTQVPEQYTAPVQDTHVSEQGTALKQDTHVSEQCTAPVQDTRVSEQGTALKQDTQVPEQCTAPVQDTRVSEQGTALKQDTQVPEQYTAPVQDTHVSEQGTALKQDTHVSEQCTAPVQDTRVSEQGTALKQDTHVSEQCTAPVQDTRVSEQGTALKQDTQVPEQCTAPVQDTHVPEQGTAAVSEDSDAGAGEGPGAQARQQLALGSLQMEV
eukprot:gene9122-16245_t